MKTCFACDKQFEHHISTDQIKPEFCSLECQTQFEQELDESVQDSIKAGLITAEGVSTFSAPPTLSAEQIFNLAAQLKIKKG